MVIPLITETAWASSFVALPEWRPSAAPILVVSPHPDDETLSLGGFIAFQRFRGVPVTLAAVTDGEHAYDDTIGLAETRTAEQTAAAARLGIHASNIIRLRLTDSDVAAQKDMLYDALLPHVTAETHLLAPWHHDFHPDHEACAAVGARLAAETGSQLTYYLFWTWHRGTPDLLSGLDVRSFPLTPELQRVKQEALVCHSSQLSHPSGDPILPDNLLWPARMPFEVFLPS